LKKMLRRLVDQGRDGFDVAFNPNAPIGQFT
jgi:hypothetical protein